jgi:hypothetical protein
MFNIVFVLKYNTSSILLTRSQKLKKLIVAINLSIVNFYKCIPQERKFIYVIIITFIVNHGKLNKIK